MVLVQHEEIIEVSADLLGRLHGRIDVKLGPVREGREDPRQHVRLDLGRNIELRADPLFFFGDLEQVCHVQLHVREHVRQGDRQHLHLVAGMDLGIRQDQLLRVIGLPAAGDDLFGDLLQALHGQDNPLFQP